MSADRELLKECHEAVKTAIEEWEATDSPEGFCFAMKHLMIVRERIAARLGIRERIAARLGINEKEVDGL